MDKKQVWITVLAGVVLIAMVFVALHNAKVLGFVAYNGGSDIFCGSTINSASSLEYDPLCDNDVGDPSTDGGTLSLANILLNCRGHQVLGNGFAGHFGIKTSSSADSSSIYNCRVSTFSNGLNISSNNVQVIDSAVDPDNTKEVFISPSKSATFLNVTFTESGNKIVRSTGATLTVQEYVVVNVTNTTGGAVGGASVEVYNGSTGASVLTGMTGSNGLAYFNVTRQYWTDSANFNFTYFVNASNASLALSGNSSGVSLTKNVLNVVNLNITALPDTTSPLVTIQSPSGAYTTTGVTINISTNEAGVCNYSIDAGLTNYTTTANASNTGFNSTFTGTDGVSYTLKAYCWDSAGNYNGTVTSTFNIAVPAVVVTPPPSSGGGGTCGDYSWTLGSWSSCANGTQIRTGTSNCGRSKTESQSCGIICANQCSVIGRSCDGNSISTCNVNEQGCYVVSKEDCGADLMCSSGRCVELNKSVIVKENVDSAKSSDIGNNVLPAIGTGLAKIRPSNFIPHGDIPAAVVDTAAGTAAVAVVAGAGWAAWMWLAVLFLPLFAVKLRHYSISVFDSGNGLRMFDNKGKVDEMRLVRLLAALQQQFGTMVLAEKTAEGMKYLVHSGFLEVRTDGLFIITGHFSKAKDSQEFENALRGVLRGYSNRIPVLKQIERASIIGAWRALMRERRSKHELEKLAF
ncbi:MAG: hypothetical protein WCK90_05550 [archaeon]